MKNLYALALLILLNSCGVISDPANNELHSDYYTQTQEGERQQVYVNVEDEKVEIYRMDRSSGKKFVDTSQIIKSYPETFEGRTLEIPPLWEHNFDLDFLTTPLKFRPAQNGIPPQLNSELNGAAYFGYRMDQYRLSYHKDPLGRSNLQSSRFGFSFGLFTGIGNTAMTPTTTNNHIETEYDGIVWQKGLAAIIGINNFTVGFSLGFDSLLDENREAWVYQEKPWIGLAVGLNLN